MGVATGDASDRLLHSETVPTRALVLRRFPAQRPNPERCLSASARGSLSSRNLAAPCSSARTSSSRAASPVRRRAEQAPGGSGPPGADETGENRASRRVSHFSARSIVREGVFFPRARVESVRLWHPCRLLRSRRPGPLLGGSHAVARRPPRPVPRGPRERRAHSRSRVPSIVSRYAHPGRAEARTKLRRLHQRRGAHVMRIAELW